MELEAKSSRLNDRVRGSVHFTEFEASELMRTLSSTRLSMFDLRSAKSASERKDVISSYGIFAPAFFYEPVITNTTMRLSVSQSSRFTMRPSSHQPHYTRPSSLEQPTKPMEPIRTLSFSERQTTLPRNYVSFKVTNVKKIDNSSHEKEESNERSAQSTIMFSSNVENSEGCIEKNYQNHSEDKSSKSYNSSNINMNSNKIWQSAPERPLSRSLFSVSESSQQHKSVNMKSISMEELRSVTSRVRTFPDSALSVIYRFLKALSDEVMTLSLQENMTGNEDTRLWELIHKYCANSNNNNSSVDNDNSNYCNTDVCDNNRNSNNLNGDTDKSNYRPGSEASTSAFFSKNSHQSQNVFSSFTKNDNDSHNERNSSAHNKMEVIPEFAAFCEPSLSLTDEHMNTNHGDKYNNLLPTIIADISSSNNKKMNSECNSISKLNSTMNEYLPNNNTIKKEEEKYDMHFLSEEEKELIESTFGKQKNGIANRFECLRNDNSVLRESVVKVNDSEVDKINYYVARQSFPIYEQNNKLQYSAEWFEPIDAHRLSSAHYAENATATMANSTYNENTKTEKHEEYEMDQSSCESSSDKARVTISAESPLYLSGMLFDPESEKFLFSGCPFLEQARLLRVFLNVDPLNSRIATPSNRKESATSNHGKLLLREYLTLYVSSWSSSSSSSLHTKSKEQQQEEELLTLKSLERESEKLECESKESYLVQTFSIVPDNCPINVSTHRTELLKPEEVANILPYVYGGALTRCVRLDPEAFATRTHSALAHRSFAGSMRLNSTLIQDLMQLRKSNMLNNQSSDVNDVSWSEEDKLVEIAPSGMTLHETVMLLTKIEEKTIFIDQEKEEKEKISTIPQNMYSAEKCAQHTEDIVFGMETFNSTEKNKFLENKYEVGSRPYYVTYTSHSSNLSVPSSSVSSSSLLSPPQLHSTRVGNTTNTLTDITKATTSKKFHDSSEEQLIKLRQEKITSAKQASVRNWEAEQDPLQLIPHTDTVYFCLHWYASRCSLLLRMHATALAVSTLQKFTRQTLAKKQRALRKMYLLWGELEQDAERIMRQHRPAPSSTARVEVVASFLLQEHMITTKEYKEELIEQLWERRKQLAYAWQREFRFNNYNSVNQNNAALVDYNVGKRKSFSAFVQSILSSVDESERKKMEEILCSSPSPSSWINKLSKRYTIKRRIVKDTIENMNANNNLQNNLQMESEATISNVSWHDNKQVHTENNKCKNNVSRRANKEVITWNTNVEATNSGDKQKTVGSCNNTENQAKQGEQYQRQRCTQSLVKLCELPINNIISDVGKNDVIRNVQKTTKQVNLPSSAVESQIQAERNTTNLIIESDKPNQCNRSLRSCKLINSFTPDVIRDRRVADELHNLFGWYIPPEELLYESHQRLFSSLQSTVLTLEEAQMATERHLLEKFYHHHH